MLFERVVGAPAGLEELSQSAGGIVERYSGLSSFAGDVSTHVYNYDRVVLVARGKSRRAGGSRLRTLVRLRRKRSVLFTCTDMMSRNSYSKIACDSSSSWRWNMRNE